jgi:hypothetical protein
MFETRLEKKGSFNNFSKLLYIVKYFINLKVAYHLMGAL